MGESNLSSISSLSPSSSITPTPSLEAAKGARIPPSQVEFCYGDEDEEEERGFGADFLEACGVCRRGLGEGRDVYICGGDAAFCSEECRSEWMEAEERFSVVRERKATGFLQNRCYSIRMNPPAAAEISRVWSLAAR